MTDRDIFDSIIILQDLAQKSIFVISDRKIIYFNFSHNKACFHKLYLSKLKTSFFLD